MKLLCIFDTEKQNWRMPLHNFKFMKNVFSLFFSIFILLFSTCSTRKLGYEENKPAPSVPIEPSGRTEEIEDEAITQNALDSNEMTELEEDETQAEPQPDPANQRLAGEGSPLVNIEELTKEISDDHETATLTEQIEDEAAPVETLQPVPAVTQTQPPVSPPQTPTPTPQPPLQTTPSPAPPVSPDLLGPAEENPPLQRESAVPRVEPRIEAPAPVARNENVELRIEAPASAARSEPPVRSAATPQNEGIVFSRTVRVTVGQIIEIPFVGTGWIYMGELASRRGIVYSSTRRDPEGQSLIFGAEEAGTYVLRFFKENFLLGSIINDYVQVIVGEAPAGGTGWFAPPYDRGRVTAMPRWPSALDAGQREIDNLRSVLIPEEPASPAATGASSPSQSTSSQGTVPSQNASSSQGTTASQGTAPSQSTSPLQGTVSGTAVERHDPNLVLQRAEDNFAGGNVTEAIALLDQYKEYYPNGTDELYWLYGQFYEANSPSRNILLSLDYYRRLTSEYPQSSRYNDARRRIAYLERFYINIQ